ncbi:glycosyltransferase family 39 protein [Pedobacter duraquae]|uniref:Dolichyl-phosphate-mannose-protein mannosyltransferase n=1 Tax=Pedobacter duraquae TaxID=425511 RepID=A0A4R6IKD0_9SPHI|nr:glycosyltransferase family 39 protein [Pedobacter duraquae]TDO22481.1 dolichyl-phosphate-mannose-protein mannosyltransferase [Pedobacter duraquae]
MDSFKRISNWTLSNSIASGIALLSFGLVILYTNYNGVGVSPDSIVYLSTARNIATNFSFTEYSGDRLVDFPLGYPIFLALIKLISWTDPLTIGPIINGLLYAVLILLADASMKVHRQFQAWNRYLILIVIAISPALLQIYAMLWSETLFLVLSLLALLLLMRYVSNPSIKKLLICCISVALACITRYAGITLVGTGLALIFFHSQLDWRNKIKHLLLFWILSVSLLCVNIIRNTLVNGTPTGSREPGIVSLQTNFSFYTQIVANWFPNHGMPDRLVAFVVTATLIFFIVMMMMPIWKRYKYGTVEHVCSVFVIAYTVFILGISTLTHFEQLNNRFLTPIYVPAIIVILIWLSRSLNKLHLSTAARKFVISIFLVGLICFNVFTVYHMIDITKNYGIPGYTDKFQKNSATALFLKKRPHFFDPKIPVYSNAHEAVYFLSDMKAAELPHKNDPITTNRFLKGSLNYLIWFYQTKDTDLLDSATVMAHRQIIGQYKFNDGAIFLFKNK